jgi:hypothetical protein
MSRYSAAPRGAAGQVVLTRQGISLVLLLPGISEADGGSLFPAIPACRHADGTISSSSVVDVRRMASEDSDQLGPGFLAVHRLSDLGDIGQPVTCTVMASLDHLNAAGELLKVLLLRRVHRVSTEERNDRLEQVHSSPHHIAVQVLTVVVVSPICDDLTHREETLELT